MFRGLVSLSTLSLSFLVACGGVAPDGGKSGTSSVGGGTPICGNRTIEKSEACDDGNKVDGDGCSADCTQIETGWACPLWSDGKGGPCKQVSVCGDGIRGEDEACDDGNTSGGDGCSDTCVGEPGFNCPVPGQPCERVAFCGDGKLSLVIGEECDDGNTTGGDGCTPLCKLEPNYACPNPGEPCFSTVVCGDGLLTGNEQCDDGNTTAGDGCSASCDTETGYICQTPGSRCEAARCGDGILAGAERCDDGNTTAGDGCDGCQVEDGWACDNAKGKQSSCHETVCGDGVKEGDEACDDGNDKVNDGCTPECKAEPNCPASPGACTSACGDGVILPGDKEECDDGNTRDGDGCSATCKIEPGYQCTKQSSAAGNTLEVPVTYRDFISAPVAGATRHPDFEFFSGWDATLNMVEPQLGADGKPVYTGICELNAQKGPCPYGAQTTSKANFDQWYRDVAGVNVSLTTKMVLTRHNNVFYFPAPPPNTIQLFPFDNAGWVGGPTVRERNQYDKKSTQHNFGFTTEVRYWFEYRGGETFDFSGDDDVWVFINRQLALDLGGLHPQRSRSITLDAQTAASLGLQKGKLYEVALFHAERHHPESNFNLTLSGFASAKTSCQSVCGDGIVTPDEECDDGVNDGSYGSCMPDCTRGPRCGDGVLNGSEECDDGLNLVTYGGFTQQCGPGCKFAPYCGDGVVSSGEACDDGPNNNKGYGFCTATCTLGDRCGDGILNGSEECDDGKFNGSTGSYCNASCKFACIRQSDQPQASASSNKSDGSAQQVSYRKSGDLQSAAPVGGKIAPKPTDPGYVSFVCNKRLQNAAGK
jgi:fibro-slime domain-containing protein